MNGEIDGYSIIDGGERSYDRGVKFGLVPRGVMERVR